MEREGGGGRGRKEREWREAREGEIIYPLFPLA
jgi:hypothetical protein